MVDFAAFGAYTWDKTGPSRRYPLQSPRLRWCYVDEKEIRVQARELGVKPTLNGPPDLGAVRFYERRAAAAKVEAIETPLPEIAVPKRRPKLTPVAASENGVTAKA
jgi:hypothetical protein